MQNVAITHADNTALSTRVQEVSFQLDYVHLKTDAARRVDAATRASVTACGVLAATAGKVGKAARATMAQGSSIEIAIQARNGNYKPAIEVLSVKMAKSLTIKKRADWDALGFVIDTELQSCKQTFNKKGLPSGKYAQALDAKAFYDLTNNLIAQIIERDNSAKSGATLVAVE